MIKSIDADQVYFNLFNSCKEAITITNVDNVIVKVNPAFTFITGYSADEVLGKNPRTLASGRHDKAFYEQMWASILTRDFWQGEIWNKRKNGEIYREWLTIRTIKNSSDQIVNYLAMFEDLSKMGDANKHIDFLLNYDSLTELPNRLKFIKMANNELSKDMPMAFISIDIMRFKNVNNSMGFAAGDIILREVAVRLTSACTKYPCIISRYGADEFIISLSNARSKDIIYELIKNINDTVQLPMIAGGVSFTPLIAMGISMFPEDGRNIITLIQQSSAAMMNAKNTPHNNTHFYDASMIKNISDRLQLEARLHEALKAEEFELYLQPKMHMDGITIAGAEALIRWNRDDKIISPDEFIPLAEEIGLINKIGNWVMQKATELQMQLISEYKNLPSEFRIAINISSSQLRQPLPDMNLEMDTDLQFGLRNIVTQSAAIDIELTESVAMIDPALSIGILKILKMKGASISIDDFGTGYSSLSYLQRLPIDALKIDQSFVKNLGNDNSNIDNEIIVKTIIAMAKSLKMKVIAEGVETEEQRQFLHGAGCDIFQGYLVSKPIPFNDFKEKFLSEYK